VNTHDQGIFLELSCQPTPGFTKEAVDGGSSVLLYATRCWVTDHRSCSQNASLVGQPMLVAPALRSAAYKSSMC